MTRKEEGEVVLGWANREERRGYIPGQFWFLIDIVWWKLWNDFISPNSVVVSLYAVLTYILFKTSLTNKNPVCIVSFLPKYKYANRNFS